MRRALQDQVKSDYLDELVSKISDYLKTLDDAGGVAEVADPQAVSVELLLKILDAVEFPRPCHSRAKRLRRRLAARDAGAQLDELIEEFTALLTATCAADRDQAGGAGWWRRWFAAEDPAAPAAAEAESDARGAGPSAGPVARASASGRGVEPVLLRFLQDLAVPAPYAPRASRLMEQLERGLTPATVGDVVRGMVALVNDVQRQLEQEKEELELFLDQLGQRLQALDAMVDGAESERLAAVASGRALDEKVAAQVDDIQQTVEDATEVGQMQGLIRHSLDNIRRHLAQRRDEEAQREAALEQQLKALNHRLVELEGESDRLRSRLAQERVQAMTDPLTAVANRLGYEKRMTQEFARWQRYQSPLSLLVCDIDHFKRINDSYGHKAGDRALVAIARSINRHVRQTDFVARVGGEEFVVLLPETTLEAAKAVAEKLCQGVAACEFVYEGTPVPITMSIGVAGFSSGDEVDDVYGRGDQALYRAKAQGRNRYVVAD